MKRLIFIILFLPALCFGQNILTHAHLTYVPEKADLLPGDFYTLEISPGYQDRNFRIEILQKDSTGKELILKSVEIRTQLTIYRKDHKMPDGKYEWDYETWIKSNESYSDEMISIGDCAGQRKLTGSLRLKSEKYTVRIHHSSQHYIEFTIDPEREERIMYDFY